MTIQEDRANMARALAAASGAAGRERAGFTGVQQSCALTFPSTKVDPTLRGAIGGVDIPVCPERPRGAAPHLRRGRNRPFGRPPAQIRT